MTLALKKIRSVGIYFAVLFFFVFVLRLLGENAMLVISLLLGVFLGALFLKHKLKFNGVAFIIYGILVLGVINYILNSSWYDFYFPILVPFFPFLLIHYLINVHKKNIPLSGALLIMAIGCLVSVIYQTVLHNGIYTYFWLGEFRLFLAFLVFFGIFMLLELGIISLRNVVIVLILSVFPEIIYVVFLYFQKGLASKLLTERFGGSVDVQANQIAAWLDLAFPMVLFLAIHEKKNFLRLLFSFLSVVYGACMLMTATRGSFFGLCILPPFFAFTARSRKATLLVLLVALGAVGVFGRGMLERTFKPNRADWMSSRTRVGLLKAGFSLGKANHYFFGIGFDNFRFEKYKYGFMKMYDYNDNMSSHNEFVEIWLGWGAIGLFGWLYLILGSIVYSARVRLPSETASLRNSIIIALLISSIHGLFDSIIGCFTFLVFLFSVFACLSFICKHGMPRGMRELPNFAPR